MIAFLCFVVYFIEMKGKLSQIEQYTWPKTLNRMTNLADNERLLVTPLTFKVPDVAEKLENNETWVSPSFLAVESGYTTWLSIAFFRDKSIMLSLFFKRNYYTADWSWLHNAMFTLEIFNQQYDKDHIFVPFLIDIKNCYYVDDMTVRYRTGFTSTAFHNRTSNQYLKNGNVYLRVSYDKSIYTYLEWFLREHFNLTLVNYQTRILWIIIVVLIIIECPIVCEAQLKELGYFNETVIKILVFFAIVVILCILHNIGAFHV